MRQLTIFMTIFTSYSYLKLPEGNWLIPGILLMRGINHLQDELHIHIGSPGPLTVANFQKTQPTRLAPDFEH